MKRCLEGCDVKKRGCWVGGGLDAAVVEVSVWSGFGELLLLAA